MELSFFVIAGPNNLLGRFALEKLWPVQYKALKDVASRGYIDYPRVVLSCGTSMTTNEADNSRDPKLTSRRLNESL